MSLIPFSVLLYSGLIDKGGLSVRDIPLFVKEKVDDR